MVVTLLGSKNVFLSSPYIFSSFCKTWWSGAHAFEERLAWSLYVCMYVRVNKYI